jgi:hypothetical protein
MSTESETPMSAPKPRVQSTKVTIAGDFLDRVSSVDSVDVSLLLSVANKKADNSRILIPFVSLDIKGSELLSVEEDRIGKLFSETISLDDLAYLAASLGRELQRAIKEYSEIAQGTAFHDQKRMSLVSKRVRTLSEQVKGCIEALDALSSASDEAVS